MARTDSDSAKNESRKRIRWVVIVFFTTVFVSGAMSLFSEEIMSRSGIVTAFLILLIIVFIGIFFDIIGVAVTSADEKPFHSMASRKVPGAHEAIGLLRNAGRVSSVCNDVIGDICGVISGAASASITAQLLTKFESSWPRGILLIMSALVAGLTVGGKAIGKNYAIKSCTSIVHRVGMTYYTWNRFVKLFRKKEKK